ncbi:HAD family hydrolase [Rhodanobacter hydrolyticus]|uniref:HAD family hydrolase n=1 Tax=Rhodanobacter hydrolyticus TaxID=2250595 RepID=A0ABW8J8N4_9GAMM
MPIRAITLDLDDTLWPVMPALELADRAVDDYLREHWPDVARAWPIPAMRELRARMAEARPDLAHDFTAQRKLTQQHVFASCGIADAPLDALWEVYYAARNTVQLWPDSLPALQYLAARWPLASLTNGNADLVRTGVQAHFAHHVCSRDVGAAKPDPRIFLAAASRFGVASHEVLHVGDDPELDVVGARRAGLRAAWINRHGETWPAELGEAPELSFADLRELADWLETHATA